MIFDLKSRKLTFKKYYLFPHASSESSNGGDKDILANLFIDAVKLRLRSDVPLGASLSGGIDSSSIISVIQKKFRKDSKLQTFSIVWPNKEIDETKYIDIIVDDTKSECNKITPTFEEFMNDLENFIYHQEEPVRTTSMYANYRIMQKVKENNIKVLLEGQGADELFGGYVPWVNHQVLVHAFSHMKIKMFFSELKAAKNRYHHGYFFILFGFFSFLLTGSNLIKKLYFSYNKSIMSDAFFHENKKYSIIFKLKTTKTLKESLERRFSLGLAALLRYGDKNAMAFSIESRFPFLDRELVKYVFSTFKTEDYVHSARTKMLFRKSMEGIVSPTILERDDKIGFETPEESWFRNKTFIKYYESILSKEQYKSRKYWNHSKVKKLLVEHSKGRKNNTNNLWKVLNVELWFAKFFPHE